MVKLGEALRLPVTDTHFLLSLLVSSELPHLLLSSITESRNHIARLGGKVQL